MELHFRDANFANSAHFNLQDGQFKKAFQLHKCDLEDRKKIILNHVILLVKSLIVAETVL